MVIIMKSTDTISNVTYFKVRAHVQLMTYTYSIKFILACIYELYQEYLITDSQEEELYKLADPEDKYNTPSVYYNEMEGENPILKMLKEV